MPYPKDTNIETKQFDPLKKVPNKNSNDLYYKF